MSPGATVSIVEAGIAYAAVIGRLHGRCFPEPWNEDHLHQLLAVPATDALIVKDDRSDEPLGYIVTQHAADESEIISIGILPGQRGLGLGKFLIAEMEARLKADGVNHLFLEVAVDNDAALALYRSVGFSDAGLRKDYYSRPGGVKADALVMRKEI